MDPTDQFVAALEKEAEMLRSENAALREELLRSVGSLPEWLGGHLSHAPLTTRIGGNNSTNASPAKGAKPLPPLARSRTEGAQFFKQMANEYVGPAGAHEHPDISRSLQSIHSQQQLQARVCFLCMPLDIINPSPLQGASATAIYDV